MLLLTNGFYTKLLKCNAVLRFRGKKKPNAVTVFLIASTPDEH